MVKFKMPVRMLPLLIALVLLLAACGGTKGSDAADTANAGPNISFEEMPAGIGRGYPLALLGDEADGTRPVQIGSAAPNFVLQLDDGSSLSLVDLRGRPVMLNFWATWCPPCRAEMPEIVEAANNDDQLVVLAMNVQEEGKGVRDFADEFAMSLPVVLDTEGKIRDLYQVRGMPTSVFIDRDGNIASIWAGFLDKDQLDKQLSEIR